MKKKERLQKRVKIKQESHKFSAKFIEYFSKLLTSFERVQSRIRESVPPILNAKHINVHSYFSEDNEHIMFIFEENKENNDNNFNFTPIKGSIFNVISGGTSLSDSSPTIRFQNGIFNSTNFSGVRLEIFGEKSKVVLSNVQYEGTLIQFGYIFSYSVFEGILNNLEKFADDTIYTFWDYYRKNNDILDTQEKLRKQEEDMKRILDKMKELFFNEEVEEKVLDDFITNNPIILERCLHIKPGSFLPQVTLENWVKENFEQDMKPDLICQNIHDDWIILDYKRAKRITKKMGTARADVISEVHELKTQLKYYREHFNEEKHRESFSQKTGLRIPSSPLCKGIIGYVPLEERGTFKKAIEDYPNWIEIKPYNDLYTEFTKYYEGFF